MLSSSKRKHVIWPRPSSFAPTPLYHHCQGYRTDMGQSARRTSQEYGRGHIPLSSTLARGVPEAVRPWFVSFADNGRDASDPWLKSIYPQCRSVDEWAENTHRHKVTVRTDGRNEGDDTAAMRYGWASEQQLRHTTRCFAPHRHAVVKGHWPR